MPQCIIGIVRSGGSSLHVGTACIVALDISWNRNLDLLSSQDGARREFRIVTTTAAAQTSGAARSAISSKHSAAGKAVAKPSAPAATTAGKPMAASSATLGAAARVDLSAATRARLAEQIGGAPRTSGTSALDDMVKDRSKALADKLVSRLKNLGIPLDDPINLKLDSLDQVTTDSPYKKKIEKMLREDPEIAKEFKDVAGLNAMKAAQKALEAFEKEKRAAKDDDGRSAAYGRYTARLMMSQDVSGTMTLDDGKLRSWSVELIDKSVGEVTAATASTRAEEVAARRTSRTA